MKRTYDQMSAFDDHVRAVKEPQPFRSLHSLGVSKLEGVTHRRRLRVRRQRRRLSLSGLAKVGLARGPSSLNAARLATLVPKKYVAGRVAHAFSWFGI